MSRLFKIGITGCSGFIGSHLFNYLNLKDDVQLVSIEKQDFQDHLRLENIVSECDSIVHLAGMNRHKDPGLIYSTNVELVQRLIDACIATNSKPHIIFSSSTQEVNDNHYGRSKLESRRLLEEWSMESSARTTSLIIPNVFGPFGRPYYNSVVPTFCHQLITGEEPKVLEDSSLKLIFVNDLVQVIYEKIKEEFNGRFIVAHGTEITVSALLEKLRGFYQQYYQEGVFPFLDIPFDICLFNTFRSYIPHDYFPRPYVCHKDERGRFVEIVKSHSYGQSSFSTTKAGITRGNHFHTRKAERFAVIQGNALIQLRKIDSDHVINYYLDGEKPSYVDMPIWYTHNITNIGDEELITLFWINEPYNQEDSDTYFVKV